jgi:hypothetical protein
MRIKISVVDDTNLQLALRQAVNALSRTKIRAEGKLFRNYGTVTVADGDCESAMILLRKDGIRAAMMPQTEAVA